MKRLLPLIGCLATIAVLSCKGKPPAEAPKLEEPPPGGPVPTKLVVLFDVHGLWGGQNIWMSSNSTAYVQVIGSLENRDPLGERRYRCQLPVHVKNTIDRLVGRYQFFELNPQLRLGVDDELSAMIAVVAEDGQKRMVSNWHKDKRCDFDPICYYLRGIAETAESWEMVFEGPFDWNWRPEGFPSLREIQNWEKP